jgi:hypothetical protein
MAMAPPTRSIIGGTPLWASCLAPSQRAARRRPLCLSRGGPGVVTVVAAWMLDRVACAGMEIGAFARGGCRGLIRERGVSYVQVAQDLVRCAPNAPRTLLEFCRSRPQKVDNR